MTNIMNPNKMHSFSAKMARPLLYILTVFLGLIFLCVYFDTTSSSYMVNTDLNKYLIPLFVICLMFSVAFYKTDKVLPRKVSFTASIAFATALFACFFIAGMFERTAAGFILFGFAVVAGAYCYLKSAGRFTWKTGSYLIIACGCIMVIGYGMAVPYSLDLHDYSFGNNFDESFGHGSYIGYILNNLSLPDTNEPWQYYHPPLHHILAAVFFKINQLLGLEYARCAENLQFLSGMYSCLNIVVWYKILRNLRLKKIGLIIPLAIIALHPTALIMGGCLNNDMLMWLFVSICILYMIKWFRTPSLKNIAILGLCLGLGMMTKVSAVMLAPAIAVVFLIKLIKSRKVIANKLQTGKARANLFSQYAVFGIISIPIGMWYPIRNLVKFGQSFSYVPDNISMSQYIGDVPLLERIIPLSLKTVLQSPFVIWDQNYQGDYNMVIKTAKTSLFGETSYLTEFCNIPILQMMLTLINYALIITSLVAIIYVLLKLKKSAGKVPYIFMGIYYLTMIIMFTYFVAQFPFQCSMDVRYVAVNIAIGALFIGKMLSMINKKSSDNNKGLSMSAKRNITDYAIVAVLMFCILSCSIFYLDSFYRVF